MGYHKFLPKLAEVSAPLRPLLSHNNDFAWTPNCENAFQQLKSAVLEQYSATGWHPISFASRYFYPAEKKYSTNKLELLAVMWATKHFRNYIYGRYFTVITDHRALHTLLNSSPKVNKTFLVG